MESHQFDLLMQTLNDMLLDDDIMIELLDELMETDEENSCPQRVPCHTHEFSGANIIRDILNGTFLFRLFVYGLTYLSCPDFMLSAIPFDEFSICRSIILDGNFMCCAIMTWRAFQNATVMKHMFHTLYEPRAMMCRLWTHNLDGISKCNRCDAYIYLSQLNLNAGCQCGHVSRGTETILLLLLLFGNDDRDLFFAMLSVCVL